MQTITKLFGPRVAVELVEEEYEGVVVPAPTTQRMHMMARVIAVGEKAKHLKVGDVVMWQWNQMIEHFNKYTMGEKIVFVLMEGDMIARLSSRKVSLDSFSVIGEWCLVRRELEENKGRILLPNQVKENTPSYMHFFLVQKGTEVDAPVETGEEVLLDRTKANPLQIDGKDMFYIQKPFIIGALGAGAPAKTLVE